ncbi:MAG: hypothetical protein AAFV38_09535 [Pseudomonadota bacterium]
MRALTLCLAILITFAALPAPAQVLQDLKDRARWKSFGVDDWVDYNPLERALPSRPPVKAGEWQISRSGSAIVQLKSLIALAEAGARQYDAVHGAANVKPPKRPTRMTLGEIRNWVRATPGQPHAIGRYQFIPSTLRRLVRRAGLPEETVFSPEVQDRLADLLLIDAGINKFLSGKLSLSQFMDNLALIWAGLPVQSGKSAYHNYAGNRATITRALFEKEMKRIFH